MSMTTERAVKHIWESFIRIPKYDIQAQLDWMAMRLNPKCVEHIRTDIIANQMVEAEDKPKKRKFKTVMHELIENEDWETIRGLL